MFGNAYFGTAYYDDSYFGPLEPSPTGGSTGKKKKGLTEEEAEGLDAFGKASLGIQDKPEINEIIEEIITPDSDELTILPVEYDITLSNNVLDSQEVDESLDKREPNIDPDIALMLAIMEATQ